MRSPCAIAAFFIVLPGAASAQQAEKPRKIAPASALRNLTPDDYFRIKDVADAQISPDGKWVAYTVTEHSEKSDNDETRTWMVPTSGGQAVPVTTAGACSSHPRWSPDGKYLAVLRKDGACERQNEAAAQVWLMDREGGETQRLTTTIQDVKEFAWSPTGDRLVLVLQDPSPAELERASSAGPGIGKGETKPRPWVIDRLHFKEDEIGYLDRRRTHLYVSSLAERKMTQITSGDYDDVEPVWSPDGRSVAFASNRGENPDSNYNTNIWVVAADNEDQGKKLLRVTSNWGTDDSPAWSPNGKWITFTSRLEPRLVERATIHLAIAPAAGGDATILTKSLDRNVYTPGFSPDGRWIYFLAEDDGAQNLLRIPATGGEITRPIAGRIKVDSFSVSRNGTIAAAIADLARNDEVYLLRNADDLRRLTFTNDAVMSQIRLGDAEYVHFKSKDGTVVAAYFYKPPDYNVEKKYPAILWLHGGPVLEYYAEFDFRARILAASGYVVLLPNPRGSSGYGQEFSVATNADWGKKDIEDDLAAVDFSVAQALSDPSRLGIGGHSFGAISTNLIITKTSRFKAAISYAGEFLNTSNFGADEYSREWEIELGLPWEKRALWDKLSAFSGVTKITTPTLVMGGDADWNCPILNGEQLYQSLKWLGVPTLLVVYPGETHDIARPSFIKDYYERYIFWFGHYVKGEGPAIPPPPKPGH